MKKSLGLIKGLEELEFSAFTNGLEGQDWCETHPEQAVTNFCSSIECLKPLCGQCLEEHTLLHESSKSAKDLETLDSVREKCAQKIKAALAMISSEVENSERLYVVDEEKLIKEGKVLLEEARLRLQKFIENYFSELEEIYKIRINENKLKTDDIRDFIAKIKRLTEELKQVHLQLDQKKQIGDLSKMLRRICLLDLRGVKQAMSSKIRKMIELRDVENYQFYIDHDYLFRLRETLEKYASLTNSVTGERISSAKISKAAGPGNKGRQERKKELPRSLVSPRDKRPIIFENVENFKRNLLIDKNDAASQLEFTENGSFIDIPANLEKREFYDYPQAGGQKSQPSTASKKAAAKPEFDEFFSASLQQLAAEALPNFPQSGMKLPSGGKEISKAGLGLSGKSRNVNFNKEAVEIDSNPGRGEQAFPKSQSFTGSVASSMHSNTLKSPSGDEKRRKTAISVAADDYFLKYAPRKYLHFFQSEGNILKMLDFQSLIHRNKKEYESCALKNDFNIPKFHKSIALPSGDLFLIGGSNPENSLEKSAAIYKYRFDQNSLLLVGNLAHPRSSHAICYHHPYIVIVGGLTTGLKVLSACEKIHVENHEVSKMGTLNEPTASACVASFSQKYIFKFGGIADGQNLSQSIEKFDFLTKKWDFVDPKMNLGVNTDFKLLSAAACLQINEKDILIFGGYDDFNRGSDQSFVFSVENFSVKGESYSIKRVNAFPLPFPEGFWNSQAIIHERRLYCLQNIENPSNEDCLEDSRFTLIFDGSEWTGF